MDIKKRLENFVRYVEKHNPETKLLERDLYFQDKLIAKKGYRVLDLDPAILYRANLLFDDLMVVGDKEDLQKFIGLLNDKFEN